jgi:uncharacterized membrane protein
MTRVTTEVSTDLDGHITHRQSPTRPNDGGASGAGDRPTRRRRETGQSPFPVSRGLAWFSVGLGLCQLLAPRRVARLIGLSDRPRTLALMRALGARELIVGVGLLARRRSSPWLWARVAGDAVDLGLLSNVLRSPEVERARVGGALAAVAGVSLLDAWAGLRAGRRAEGMAARKPISRSITIARSPAEVYRFWRDFQNLPRFMAHLESVETLDSKRSYWRGRRVGGKTLEWNAEIVADVENELISWRTFGGGPIAHAGMVLFVAAPGGRGTEIHVQVIYEPPSGALGRLIALAVGQGPSQQVERELRRLKQVLEVGDVTERARSTP